MVTVSVLAAYASDADNRKYINPREHPKHYIDIDNYPSFQGQCLIPQTWDSVVLLYGGSFVIDQGIFPCATITSYVSLVNCFLWRD